MNGRLAVYTCIAGDYDSLLPPQNLEPRVDYFCFTDRPQEPCAAWRIRPLPVNFGNGQLDSRYVKMHPHLLFPEYDCSIYIDGNIAIVGDLAALAQSALRHDALALYDHPFRDCVYAEARECALLGHDWCWRIRRQMNTYAAAGLPPKNGLFEANLLIRRHHDAALIRLMASWWQAFLTGIRRDQLALPFLLWRQGIGISRLGASDIRFSRHHFAAPRPHKRETPWQLKLRRRINRIAMTLWPWPTR